ncbi:MAG: hypothetical protein G01um101419_218 [Parcubacteria group bacterium Gr01-1014_19]|nr:MAG: hypothetical protein G01um101419_218 [Parcubacteria group bacterium Gr01-1014_19]
MPTYDLVVVLGSRMGLDSQGVMRLAPITAMKVRAAGFAWQSEMADRFVLSGGHTIRVRFGLNLGSPVFGVAGSDQQPNFSDAAKDCGRWFRSEASVMAEALKKEFGVFPESLILEEDSYCTADNAKMTQLIVARLKAKNVGLITHRSQMEKAKEEFLKAGIAVTPLIAEQLHGSA